MPRLLLLRHAKSSWDDPALDDFSRPLNTRGRRAAPLMGRHMAVHHLLPQKVLCSAARRTRETLAGLLPYLDTDIEARVTRDLYMASEDRMIDVVRAHGNGARTLLVIGHNPGMQDTARALIGAGNPELVDDIAEKFPTAALAVIDFDAKRWTDIEPGTGRIVAFFRPKELEVIGADDEDGDD